MINQCPAQIFMELWATVVERSSIDRVRAPGPNDEFVHEVRAALTKEQALDAAQALDDLLEAHRNLTLLEVLACQLTVMREIDHLFLSIHPRSLRLTPTYLVDTPPILPWLVQARETRLMTGGWYTQNGTHRVIANGPLQRVARTQANASADSLAEYFSALRVVPRTLSDHDGRVINVSPKVIPPSAQAGISVPIQPRQEKIMFIPVLEKREDLQLTPRTINGNDFVTCRPVPGVSPSQQVANALRQEEQVVIAVAPEFVMPEAEAKRLARVLRETPVSVGMLVAGSGHTETMDPSCSLSWNESCVLNSLGKVLWTQRKLWPARIDLSRAKDFNLPSPVTGAWHEDTAAGDTLMVVDIEGLGRCMVLICQDLKNNPLARQSIEQYQPDWVITPILDRGVSGGRWVHQEIFGNLGKDTQARFLVCDSLASIPIDTSTGQMQEPFALAVGPFDGHGEMQNRQIAQLHPTQTEGIKYAVVTWNSDESVWKRSILTVE